MALAEIFRVKPSFSRLLLRYTQAPIFISVVRKKSITEQLGIPCPPKRPLTPYIRFLVHSQADLRRKFPDVKYKEVCKKVLHLWQNLSFDEKNEWSLAYKKEKAVYDAKYKDYLMMLTPEQTQRIKELKFKLSEEKRRVSDKKIIIMKGKEWQQEYKFESLSREQKKKKNEELGKPKAPRTAFALFLISYMDKNAPVKNILTEAASKWKSLPPETQQEYHLKAKEQRKIYECELTDWEAKMLKAGRTDLIRIGQLEELSRSLVNLQL